MVEFPDGAREAAQKILDAAWGRYQRDLAALAAAAADAVEDALERRPELVREVIGEYSRMASQAADDYYRVVRGVWEEYGGASLPPMPDAGPVPPDRVLWQVQGGFNDSDYAGLTYKQVVGGRSRAGLTVDDLWPGLGDVGRARQFASDMVHAAARLTGQRNVRIDPSGPRWARVPMGAVTCAFCVMLASRGFEYSSEESAGRGMQYHDHCDCQIVPAWGRASLRGYDPDKYASMWRAARRDAGAGAGWRRALESMRRMYPDQLTDGAVGAGEFVEMEGSRISTVERLVGRQLAALGRRVRALPVSTVDGKSSPDYEIDGDVWEMKPLHGAGRWAVHNALRKAKRQSPLVILHIANDDLDDQRVADDAADVLRRSRRIERVWLFRDGRTVRVIENERQRTGAPLNQP